MRNAHHRPLRFLTLGPKGTCHEEATLAYLELHDLRDVDLVFITDFHDAVSRLKNGSADFFVQGCAHPQAVSTLEKFPDDVPMVDCFMYPTKELALIRRKEPSNMDSIGYMPATADYLDLSNWKRHIHKRSNPLVEQGLLSGEYDFAISFTRQHTH